MNHIIYDTIKSNLSNKKVLKMFKCELNNVKPGNLILTL